MLKGGQSSEDLLRTTLGTGMLVRWREPLGRKEVLRDHSEFQDPRVVMIREIPLSSRDPWSSWAAKQKQTEPVKVGVDPGILGRLSQAETAIKSSGG